MVQRVEMTFESAIPMLAVFCLLIQTPRIIFINKLPHYGDTSFFQYFSKFGYHSQKTDILYLTATRVPILWYYGLLQFLAGLLKLEFHKFEQIHHLLLLALEAFLLGLLAKHFGINPFLVATVFTLLNFPPRSFSYFGSGEIFIGLFDCLSLLLIYTLASGTIFNICLGFFCTWYLSSIKFLYLPKWLVFAYLVDWETSFLIGSLLGIAMWLIPLYSVGFSRILQTIRSYKSENDKRRTSFLTPIQRDFFLMHGPLLFPIVILSNDFNMYGILIAIFFIDWFVIIIQHNGYNYMALPLFWNASLILLSIPIEIAIPCVCISLYFGTRNKVNRCYPIELSRNESLLYIHRQIATDIKDHLDSVKNSQKRPLLAYGSHTTVHVLSNTPFYLDEHYAHLQIQDDAAIENMFPDLQLKFKKQLCQEPPLLFLQNLDQAKIISKKSLELISGYQYNLWASYNLGKIQIYKRSHAIEETLRVQPETNLVLFYKKSTSQIDNYNFLNIDLQNEMEPCAVADKDLMDNINTSKIDLEYFLQEGPKPNKHYFLITQRNQNQILDAYQEELSKKHTAYRITKCA